MDNIGTLILGRRTGEQINLRNADGTNILVTILRISQNAVKISFTAPKNINIVRSEIDHRDGGHSQ